MLQNFFVIKKELYNEFYIDFNCSCNIYVNNLVESWMWKWHSSCYTILLFFNKKMN